MAFMKNDRPLYFKAAQDAVHLEQSGQYHEAARMVTGKSTGAQS
ncbi:MAG: hypothetical protein ACL7AY_06740 [Candidatus Arsenophonus phytopathogenicus]